MAVLTSLSPRPVRSGWGAVSHGAVLAAVAPSPSAVRSHPELPSAGEDLGQPGTLWLRGNPLSWACPLLRQGVPGGPASRLDVRGRERAPCPSCPKIEREGERPLSVEKVTFCQATEGCGTRVMPSMMAQCCSSGYRMDMQE